MKAIKLIFLCTIIYSPSTLPGIDGRRKFSEIIKKRGFLTANTVNVNVFNYGHVYTEDRYTYINVVENVLLSYEKEMPMDANSCDFHRHIGPCSYR